MRYLILICALPLVAQAASFDCSKAVANAEKLICSSGVLSQLDEELAVAYKISSKRASDSEPLVLDQKRWLRSTRNKCSDEKCLEAAYRKRIGAVSIWNEDALPDDSGYGNYISKRKIAVFNPDNQSGFDSISAEDCLTIKKASSGVAAFAVYLNQTNGHTCSLEGKVSTVGNTFTYIPDPSLADDQDCKLRVTVKRNTLALSDPDDACKKNHCGMRASFNGVEFLRTEMTAKQCEPE